MHRDEVCMGLSIYCQLTATVGVQWKAPAAGMGTVLDGDTFAGLPHPLTAWADGHQAIHLTEASKVASIGDSLETSSVSGTAMTTDG